jgi:hypothetical protein
MSNEPDAPTYEPVEEEWLEDSSEGELPRRPRRRLLGVGGNPIALALTGVLLVACGFIGGVLVEKDQSSSSSAGGDALGLASRFAALHGAAGTGASSSAGLGRGASGGAGASQFGGGGGGAGATIGQVAYVSGHTLYVTTSEGNTVKVTTSAVSTVSKTVKSDAKGIHPGETVIVTGSPGANGSVSAESIRVSEAGASAGLGALFGARGGASEGSGGARGGGGGPALFGG